MNDAARIGIALVAVLSGGCGRKLALAAPGAATLSVPRASGPVKIDAEVEGKKTWEADVGATGNFKTADGRGMVPYTEAKARWGDGKLYLMLYAGDLDLEGKIQAHDAAVEQDDAFKLEFGGAADRRVVWVTVLGTIADARCHPTAGGQTCDASWDSHAQVAVDRDGTLNRIGDNDEEWVVEMSIPLAELGFPNARPGTRIPFSISRCEVGHAKQHDCGGWGIRPAGTLTLSAGRAEVARQ